MTEREKWHQFARNCIGWTLAGLIYIGLMAAIGIAGS